ncbi:MAG: hypothetical protein LBU85_11980 [Treponema sp.]|jgi:hypothetical protein|nr:hypothetical protein [Treponema sp.]
MIIFSTKKIEKEIIGRTITSRQFIIYSFFVLGNTFALLKTSKYPVNIEAYKFAYFLSFIHIFINIVKYIYCYNIIKNKDIFIYLYAIIPISFILSVRYIIVMLPLIVINLKIIKYYNLDFNYWNVINSQIIGIMGQILIFINFIIVIKRLYKNNYSAVSTGL